MRFVVLLAVLSMTVAPVPAAAQVLINEILFKTSELRQQPHQWVELYNAGATPAALEGWTVRNRSQPYSFPPLSLPPGGVLVLHFAQGSDVLEPDASGAIHRYTGDEPGTQFWNPNAGDVALHNASGEIVDYLCWGSNAAPYTPGEAHSEAVRAGIWTQDSHVNIDRIHAGYFTGFVGFLRHGDTLGRTAGAPDTNRPSDFQQNGGTLTIAPSPGRRNFDEIFTFAEALHQQFPQQPNRGPAPQTLPSPRSSTRPAVAEKKPWTVALYMSCDRGIAAYCFNYLKSLEKGLRDHPAARFVALVDLTAARESSSGDLILYSSTSYGEVVDLIKAQGITVRIPEPDKVLPLRAASGDLTEDVRVGTKNMGDPATLQEFLSDVQRDFPAEKYGLIMVGTGHGWKHFGADESWKFDSGGLPVEGIFKNFDALYMQELRTGLPAGQPFEFIAFQAGYMASVEVAHQVRRAARYLIASEAEMPHTGFPWGALAELIAGDPGGARAAVDLVSLYSAAYQDPAAELPEGSTWGLSVIDLSATAELVSAMNRWGDELRQATRLFQRRGDAVDNVQIRLKEARLASEASKVETDLIDISQFAEAVAADDVIPQCGKRLLPPVRQALQAAVVTRAANFDGSGGLSIYFPSERAGFFFTSKDKREVLLGNDYYDQVETRESSGDTRMVVYAANHDKLPYAVRTMEPPTEDLPPSQWPAPAAPGLDFVAAAPSWPRFLEAYYHPVADNRIASPPPLSIEPPGGCSNPVDIVSVAVGTPVEFTAAGSSDDRVETFRMPQYWDTDSDRPCLLGPECRAPSKVPIGANAAEASTDNLDEDRDTVNTTFDDKDVTGSGTTVTCTIPRSFFVTLHSWDLDHNYEFHDTRPNAEYVHPQTDSHRAFVNCVATATQTQTSGTRPFNEQGTLNEVDFSWVDSTLRSIGLFPVKVRPGTGVLQLEVLNSGGESLGSVPGSTAALRAGSATGPAGAIAIPDGQDRTVYTNQRGFFTLRFVTGTPGTGTILFTVPGIGELPFRFTIVARLAPAPDSLTVTPVGSVTVGQPVNLTVVARRNGQPVRDSVVTFASSTTRSANAEFTTGTLWRRNFATQLRTLEDGRTFATFRALGNGPVHIDISAGTVVVPVVFNATGGANPAPSRVEFVNPPLLIGPGDVSLTIRVVGNETPLPAQSVRISLPQGAVTVAGSPAGTSTFTLTTDARGEAVFRFRAAGSTPVQLLASVANTTLEARVTMFVTPAAP